MLSTKPGKEAWVEPVIEKEGYHFRVWAHPVRERDEKDEAWKKRVAAFQAKMAVGNPKDGTKLARGANFRCVMSGTPIAGDYIKAEGKAGRMGARLMAIVAEGERGRVYLPPTPEQEAAAKKAKPEWKPEGDVPARLTGGTCVPYGLSTWGELFTPRQLVALGTIAELVSNSVEQIRVDAVHATNTSDNGSISQGGSGSRAYSEAVAIYLAFALSKVANIGSALASWMNDRGAFRETFARQAIPMTWDYAESNPFADAGGSLSAALEKGAMSIEAFPGTNPGIGTQADASTQNITLKKVVSTDPPYYDNIAYADLSDFFYVWLRHSLRQFLPDIFATLAVPKTEELVAAKYRHGSKEKAEAFFLKGMTHAMHRLAEQSHPAFPVSIYYAFKQAEDEDDAGTASTGWETFLDAVIRAGFALTGTWPMRTEGAGRMIARDTNALASSIVLVCRPRAADAPTATRREFVAALQRELPEALRHLQAGNIAPVDLAQAAIGPGMAVFTRYARVLDAQGNALSVREALALINDTLDTALAEQEGDFDADSRWALAWFEQHGFAEGEFGVALVLATAKNTSIDGMRDAGILFAKAGRVRLFKAEELPDDWDPAADSRLTAWETVHHLIRVLGTGGESAAAELAAKLGTKAESARELAYRLYGICERNKRAAEALAYNGLVQSWPELVRLAQEVGGARIAEQTTMFGESEE
jgi:putative DNA methylase